MRTRCGRGPPGGVDVPVVEQGIDQDRAAVPGLLPLPGVGAQQHERLLPLGLPAAGRLCRRTQLLVRDQGTAGSEPGTAQGDGVKEPVGAGVAVTEVVDQSDVGGEVVGRFLNAPFRPPQGLVRAAGGVQFAGDGQVGAAVRGEVGRVHGDPSVQVSYGLGQPFHQVLLCPAGAVAAPGGSRQLPYPAHPLRAEDILVVEGVDAGEIVQVTEQMADQPPRGLVRVGACCAARASAAADPIRSR